VTNHVATRPFARATRIEARSGTKAGSDSTMGIHQGGCAGAPTGRFLKVCAGMFPTKRISGRRIAADVATRVIELYATRYFDFNVKHFHEKLVSEHGYRLSYGWTKRVLQDAGLLKRAEKRGAHRRKRLRKPLPGMLLHQDGSRHHRVPDVAWDLIVTMDDATLKFAPSVGTRNLVLMFTKATVFSRGVQINYPSPTPARLSSGAIVSRVTPGPPATAHSG
jgi:hypothetical protein